MGVDSGYGTGTARSASNSASRANASRAAANRRRSGARTARARTIANRTAAATPSTVRDRYNPAIPARIGSAIDYVFEGPNGGMINGQRTLQSGVSPWKALAMYAARVARAVPEGANMSAAMNVARRAPRGPVAHRLQHAVSRGAWEEFRSIADDFLNYRPAGYSSTMFPDHIMPLFKQSEIQSIYRAAAKVSGRQARSELAQWKLDPTPFNYSPFHHSALAGRTLRDISRKGLK